MFLFIKYRQRIDMQTSEENWLFNFNSATDSKNMFGYVDFISIKWSYKSGIRYKISKVYRKSNFFKKYIFEFLMIQAFHILQ